MRIHLKGSVNRGQAHCRDLYLKMAGAYRHKPAVSLCTGMKDRLPHLQKTVLENLENNRDYPYFELVLLNYNCPNPGTENWVRRELSEHIASVRRKDS